jgi:hypothetical protein
VQNSAITTEVLSSGEHLHRCLDAAQARHRDVLKVLAAQAVIQQSGVHAARATETQHLRMAHPLSMTTGLCTNNNAEDASASLAACSVRIGLVAGFILMMGTARTTANPLLHAHVAVTAQHGKCDRTRHTYVQHRSSGL